MGLFRRIGRGIRKVGAKALEQISVGARKISKTAKRAQPILAQAGEVATLAGAVTGQPEIAAFGETLGQASALAGAVGGTADLARSGIKSATEKAKGTADLARGGIEKVRKLETAEEGINDIMQAGQKAYGFFGGTQF
jgi:methyl-accepting chemotaxis protein